VRATGIVPQSLSQFANSNSQSAVEVDKRIPRPDTILDLGFSDDFAGIFKKDDEQSERLLLESNPFALLQQFARSGVGLERTKSIDSPVVPLHDLTSG
jgi:hypothetical protein